MAEYYRTALHAAETCLAPPWKHSLRFATYLRVMRTIRRRNEQYVLLKDDAHSNALTRLGQSIGRYACTCMSVKGVGG
eukprot:2526079-Pleurochrysis_carterae.AAC.3